MLCVDVYGNFITVTSFDCSQDRRNRRSHTSSMEIESMRGGSMDMDVKVEKSES